MNEFTMILKVGTMLFLVSTMPSAAVIVMGIIVVASLVDDRKIRRLPDDQRLQPRRTA